MARPRKEKSTCIGTSVSTRNYYTTTEEFTNRDYYQMRPGMAIPTDHQNIMIQCNDVYYREELIRNVIDLMADFTVQGVRISHPVKYINDFCVNWFNNKIKGQEVSERIANYLYRLGNVIIHKETGKLKGYKNNKIFSYASDDIINDKYPKNIIPSKYTFLNPIYVSANYAEIRNVNDKVIYYIDLPKSYSKDLKLERTTLSLPENKTNSITSNRIPLDPKSTIILNYKKDDWLVWARPLTYSLLETIFMIRRIRMADRAAVEVAASYVRIYRLGDIANQIVPSQAHADKLQEMLKANTHGGMREFIWTEDIDIVESNFDLAAVLGEDKYKPYLNNLYSGLGVPPSLTGTFSKDSSQNSYVSLKTLMNRLEYGRNIISNFWNKEFEHLALAMGWSKVPVIEYDRASLLDETNEKALLIQLADRNLISEELLHRMFKQHPEMESVRIKKEQTKRDRAQKPLKPGPYASHKDVELTMLRETDELNDELNPTVDTEPAQPGVFKDRPGRPRNSKDKKQRKSRTDKFSASSIATEIKIKNAIDNINDMVKSQYLKILNKENLRQLTNAECDTFEKLKFATLLNIPNTDKVSAEDVSESINKKIDMNIYQEYISLIKETELALSRELSLDEKRNIQIHFCVKYNKNWNNHEAAD